LPINDDVIGNLVQRSPLFTSYVFWWYGVLFNA